MSDADLNNKQPAGQICFKCDFCGKQISVPSVHAGKKGKCPQCRNTIPVPYSSTSSSRENTPIDSKPDLDMLLQPGPPHERSAADQPKDQQYEKLCQSAGLPSFQPPPPLKRKFPWLIDIFLYPANLYGMIFIGIVVLVPLLCLLLIYLLIEIIGVVAAFFIVMNFIVDIVLLMFVYWFLAECICDSAAGNLRVPNTADNTPGLAEIGLRSIRILFCLVVYLIPACLYHKYTHGFDSFFWIIAGCGVFLYPMALLGVLMFDSICGLNPLVIIPSIFSAFLQYCGLIVLIGAIIFSYVQVIKLLPDDFLLRLVLSPLVRAVALYLTMIAAHLLGRFYFKYQEKLNWDV